MRNATREATILADRQVTGPCDVFLEYAGDFPQQGRSSQLLHTGTGYKLTPHQQLDFHAAVGLSAGAPKSFIGVGYSVLWLPR